MTLNRSNKGIKDKYDEAMKILEYSVLMVEFFEIKEFNNVIAVQLRLILCDTSWDKDKKKLIDNSLIKKINNNPKLFPVKELVELDGTGTAYLHNGLFDFDMPRLELDKWLKQVIYKINIQDKLQKLTIFDVIKEYANKSGGAHVDASLPEKAFLVEDQSAKLLCDIVRGLFRSTGRNINQQSKENLIHLISTYNKKI